MHVTQNVTAKGAEIAKEMEEMPLKFKLTVVGFVVLAAFMALFQQDIVHVFTHGLAPNTSLASAFSQLLKEKYLVLEPVFKTLVVLGIIGISFIGRAYRSRLLR